MASASIMVFVLGLIPTLLILLLPIALVIAFQVWLCGREVRWLGLILPILAFLLSLILCLSMTVYTNVETVGFNSVTGDSAYEENQVQVHFQDLTPAAALTVAVFFLISNIPTIILLGIFFYQKNRRDFRNDLNKMTIQDLE